MKKLLSIVFMLTIFCSAFCKNVVNINTCTPILEKEVSTAPIQTIEDLGDEIRVSYTFEYMVLDSLPNNTFIISFEDFGMRSVPGLPALPIKMDAFKLDRDQTVDITLIEYSYVEYPFEIGITKDFIPDSESDIESYSSITNSNADTCLQQNIISHNIQSYKDINICYVYVMPIMYDGQNKSIKVATDLTYNITFNTQSDELERSPFEEETQIDPIVSSIFLNGDPRQQSGRTKLRQSSSYNQFDDYMIDTPYDYLIISTPKFESSIKYFSEWKKTLGFQTHIILNDNWESASEVNDTIYRYCQMYPNLNYLLIVGDSNEVPAKSKLAFGQENYHLTDYYYGCFSQEDEFKYI